MDVKLKVSAGKHAGKEIAISRNEFLIGRGEECHLRAGSDLISRRHCQVVIEGEVLSVIEFGSKNGTYVNGERISKHHPLAHGDRLLVGPLEFEVVVEQTATVEASTTETKPSPAQPRVGGGSSIEDVVCDWLNSADARPSLNSTETKTLSLSETEEIAAAIAQQEADAGDAAASEGEGDKDGPKRRFEQPAPETKDSREAAAHYLQKMARRR